MPGVQEWMTNMTDTGNFAFKPQMVADNSPQDLNPGIGNITALYTVTAPQASGSYVLTFYAEGVTLQFTVDVGSQTSTSISSANTSTSSVNATSTMSGSNSTSTSFTTTTAPGFSAGPSVSYYSAELALIVVGFGLLVYLAVRRYPRS